ncbi:hypothetical protein [uncultured Prevotella sp.]|uniref:hypothetical protein n=1 Tax=uncultured Prevotella sp. TaxID=159272 RepID=UPI00258A8D8C|nr:hypothetical protein [uncultured Prevotella sp.]
MLLAVKKTSDNTAVKFTDNGDYTYRISMMPTADITVSTTEIRCRRQPAESRLHTHRGRYYQLSNPW